MGINLTDFLRGNLLSKLKEIVRLIISLGAVNVDLAVDRMLTPPESKLREFAKELKLSEAQTTEFIAEVRVMIYVPPHIKVWLLSQGGSKFVTEVLEEYKKITESPD